MLVLPVTTTWMAVQLTVLGVGLRLFAPANNTLVMSAIPANCSGTGGGLVNKARGLGTALGVTLQLHLCRGQGIRDGWVHSVAVLLAAAFIAAVMARLSPVGNRGPVQ